MATAATLSSQRVEPGSFTLATSTLPPVARIDGGVDPAKVVSEWLDLFHKTLAYPDFDMNKVFLAESFWRDQLCLSWNLRKFGEMSERLASIGC
jgi:hypothetical protein